ncbi:hypothetical protein GP486_007963 [Trichoglossum hirsutum]|uniref:Uncharacterized protein n=1 Tax=Trichoglossum hirsutum TaxID=265104 RepID=A0A9P8IEJ4_9PEZI|nr:hypothetical protein GP486_007963 [Trichoglossum hirsutum]
MATASQHQHHRHGRRDRAGARARSRDDGTAKPTAVFRPRGGREWTLSVAVPGSIVANADMKAHLPGGGPGGAPQRADPRAQDHPGRPDRAGAGRVLRGRGGGVRRPAGGDNDDDD